MRREVAADRHAEARLRRDQLVAVDRAGDRLAHARVAVGLARVVGREDDLALGGADHDGEARVLLQPLDQLGRLEAREGVDVAGQQRVHLRRRVLDDLEHHRVELDRARVAVGRRAHQDDRIAFLAFPEHERPGADRVLVVGRRGLGMHDPGVAQRQAVEQEGVGRLQRHLHGRGIDHLDLVDVGVERLGGIGRIGGEQPVEREFHDRRVERLAVVELHAGPQLEDVFLAVGRDRPALGEAGPDVAVAVDAAQRLEDGRRRDLADRRGGVLRRVEHRRLERHADDETVLRRTLRPRLDAQRGSAGGQAGQRQQMTAVHCVHSTLH